MSAWSKYAAKFLTALAGVAALAISQGLLVGTAAKWVAIVVTVGAAVGVWAVPNAPASTPSLASAEPAAPEAARSPGPATPAPPK